MRKVWNRQVRFKKDFDSSFPDGVFADPISKEEPLYNVRALDKYCEEHGIEPSDLSEEQLQRFEVRSR
jgi:hypothetical protein